MSEGYAGDVSPTEAWEMLSTDPQAVLVDVRTEPEWSFVGLPSLAAIGKAVVRVSWQDYPSMELNRSFVEEVRAAGVSPGQPVLLLCRSGARSAAAAQALTRAGFAKAFNVAAGFEGPPDAERHRGRVGGWKVAGLPWTQG